MATVHIGIVTYNSIDDLPGCFAGIRAQAYAPVYVTVLDNASTDGSAEWAKVNAPLARLILNPNNVGFAAAHNRIITACRLQPGDYYLALNPDVQMEPGYVRAIVDAIDADDRIGWATGKLLWTVGSMADPIIYSVGHGLFRSGYTINIGHGMPDQPVFQTSREVFGAPGAAVLMKQAFIADLTTDGALYDESMFLYGEDTDLDWRARLRGWTCWYVAGAVAQHHHAPPDHELRMLAVAHRYLSAIKNAYLVDLLSYNLPLIVGHCALRLLTPRAGVTLLRTILRHAPSEWHRRRSPVISRRDMWQWFRWSLQQPTGQPMSYVSRIWAAIRSANSTR